MNDMIEVFRVQRHDFMNHLQVILGLLQLQKYDRAGQYIKEVAADMDREGALARLGAPGVVSAVLLAEVAAGKQGVNISKNIGAGLDRGLQHEMTVAEIIREMLALAVRLSQTEPCSGGSIDFEIAEKDGEYVFQAGFRAREGADSLAPDAGIVFMQEASEKVQGRLVTAVSADGITVITLSVPIS